LQDFAHARRLAGGVDGWRCVRRSTILVSNFHGPWLVDIVASMCSMAALGVLLKCWRPKDKWEGQHVAVPEIRDGDTPSLPETRGPAVASFRNSVHTPSQVIRAWVPWVLLSLLVFSLGRAAGEKNSSTTS